MEVPTEVIIEALEHYELYTGERISHETDEFFNMILDKLRKLKVYENMTEDVNINRRW